MAESPEKLSKTERAFAAQVKTLRQERGLSQADLVARLNESGEVAFTQTVVSRIEQMTRSVKMVEAEALAAFFGRPVALMMKPGSEDDVASTAQSQMLRQVAAWESFEEQFREFRSRIVRLPDVVRMLDEALASGDLSKNGADYLHFLRRLATDAIADDLRAVDEIAAVFERRSGPPLFEIEDYANG